jgi:hypothetical protein
VYDNREAEFDTWRGLAFLCGINTDKHTIDTTHEGEDYIGKYC